MAVSDWSTTPADNNDDPPNGAPENWAPGDVNATIRQMMADIRSFYDNTALLDAAHTFTGMPTFSSTGPFLSFTETDAGSDEKCWQILVNNDRFRLFTYTDAFAAAVATPVDITRVGTTVTSINLTATAVQANGIEIGFRGIPQNAQTGNYTCVIGDAGKHIYHSSAAGSGDTYTIPANSSVAYEIGTAITFINSASAAVTIAITTDTMTLAGTTSTGSRTLAQNGMATAVKVTSTAWIISGSGLS